MKYNWTRYFYGYVLYAMGFLMLGTSEYSQHTVLQLFQMCDMVIPQLCYAVVFEIFI